MGLMAKTGAASYAGPMLAGDFCIDKTVDFTLENFWQCLAGPTHVITELAENNPSVNLTGTIWGGNLAMMVSLLGTEYFPIVEGGILYVEDVNEHPYRIERMPILIQKAACPLIERHSTALALRIWSCSSSSMFTMPILCPCI